MFNNEREALAKIEKLVNKVLPDVLRSHQTNIKEGVITKIENDARLASVQIVGTNQTVTGLRFPKGVSDVVVGDRCLLASIDPTIRSSLFIIAIF